MDIRFERLTDRHVVSEFHSGQSTIDDFLTKYALINDRRGLGTTIVALDAANGEVVGYFTLAAASVQTDQLPPAEARGLPKYPIPGILLARLAIHLKSQGQGLGKRLLIEAMRHALVVGEHAGWRYLMVDALDDEVVAFYVRMGFNPLKDRPRNLYLGSKTVAIIVGVAEGRQSV